MKKYWRGVLTTTLLIGSLSLIYGATCTSADRTVICKGDCCQATATTCSVFVCEPPAE